MNLMNLIGAFKIVSKSVKFISRLIKSYSNRSTSRKKPIKIIIEIVKIRSKLTSTLIVKTCFNVCGKIKLASCWPQIGASWPYVCPNLVPTWPQLGPTWPIFAQPWSNLAPLGFQMDPSCNTSRCIPEGSERW